MAIQARVVVSSNRFGDVERDVRLGLVQEVRRGAEGAVGHAKQYIIAKDAIRTGDLYRSVHAEYDNAGTSATLVADVPYASFVHDGTERMEPRPFFTVAVDAETPEIERRLARIFETRYL